MVYLWRGHRRACDRARIATSYSLVGGTALRQMQWAHPYVIDTKTSQRWRRTGYLFHLSAIVAGLAALILFFLGVYSMIAAVGADA